MRVAALAVAGVLLGAGIAAAQDEPPVPSQNWSFNGPFGTFDRASAQRGFQVYKEVCSGCHSMKEGYYRNLEGIGLTADEVKAIASTVTVPGETDDQGQAVDRPATPADHFKSPFASDKAARAANNGALPPDQSVIEKAREGGADYIYALLNGYRDPPPDVKMGQGMYYNEAFHGGQIAMPPPLQQGSVTYADGTPATVEQEARDVAQFLTYMSNPELEQRKRMGVKVVLFLAMMTGLTYAVKRKVWADVH